MNAERDARKRTASTLRLQRIAQDRYRRLHNAYIAKLEDEHRKDQAEAAKIPAPSLQLIDGTAS